MRILIDTNMFIYRENHKILSNNLQKLLNVLNNLGHQIIVHPLSKIEIEKDKDEKRKKIALSKISTYLLLEMAPSPDKDHKFLNIVQKPSNRHDYVDNNIIYSAYRNAVSFLITEDKDLHKKAIKLNIQDRVLSIEDALTIFEYSRYPTPPPSIKKEKVYNLDINDKIFDSLKEEYPEFGEWFEKISKEGRDCLVHYNKDGTMGAVLIYKIENEPVDAGSILPAKERLKISTLKVSSTGNKIGELFIRLSTEYSSRMGLKEIYLTHFTKPDDYLVYLIEEYGFIKVGRNNRGEDVFIKELSPDKGAIVYSDPVKLSKIFYPQFFDGKTIKKFIVPILPEYHEKLFIDTERQSTLNEHSGGFIVEGNAIKKAYLSHSNIKKIAPGDLLLFYRSRDSQEITGIGVVEQTIPDLNDVDDIMKYVGKRTVYSPQEIEKIAESTTLVILFIYSCYLPVPVSLRKLKALKILKTAPQSIQELSHENYLLLKKAGGIDESFTVN